MSSPTLTGIQTIFLGESTIVKPEPLRFRGNRYRNTFSRVGLWDKEDSVTVVRCAALWVRRDVTGMSSR